MDFKDSMISAIESGYATEATAYDFVADQYASSYDEWRTWAKENGWRNPLCAVLSCKKCNWSENAHGTHWTDCDAFTPWTIEEVEAANRRKGFPR